MEKRFKRLRVGFLALCVILSQATTAAFLPMIAFAAEEESSEINVAEELEKAQKAANDASTALEAAESAKKDAQDALKEIKDLSLDEEETAVSDALEDVENAKTDIENESKTLDDVDDAVDTLEPAVNKAKDAADTAFDTATEAIELAEDAIDAAKEAADQANIAIEAANMAEEAYHKILQDSVNKGHEGDRAVALAYNAMLDAQKNANAAEEVLKEAMEAAVDAAEEAIEAAELAVQEAQNALDNALEELEEAEAAYKEALESGSENVQEAKRLRDIALEAAYEAADAAIAAKEAADEAIKNAKEIIDQAQDIIGIADDVIDTANDAIEARNARYDAEYQDWLDSDEGKAWTAFMAEANDPGSRLNAALQGLPVDGEGNFIVNEAFLEAAFAAAAVIAEDDFDQAIIEFTNLKNTINEIETAISNADEATRAAMAEEWLRVLQEAYNLAKETLLANGIATSESMNSQLEQLCELLIEALNAHDWQTFLDMMQETQSLIGNYHKRTEGIPINNAHLRLNQFVRNGLNYGYLRTGTSSSAGKYEATADKFFLNINDPGNLPAGKVPVYLTEADYDANTATGFIEVVGKGQSEGFSYTSGGLTYTYTNDKRIVTDAQGAIISETSLNIPARSYTVSNNGPNTSAIDSFFYDYSLILYNDNGEPIGRVVTFYVLADDPMFGHIEAEDYITIGGTGAGLGRAAFVELDPGYSATLAYCACGERIHSAVFSNQNVSEPQSWVIPFHYHDNNLPDTRGAADKQKTGITFSSFEINHVYRVLNDFEPEGYGGYNPPERKDPTGALGGFNGKSWPLGDLEEEYVLAELLGFNPGGIFTIPNLPEEPEEPEEPEVPNIPGDPTPPPITPGTPGTTTTTPFIPTTPLTTILDDLVPLANLPDEEELTVILDDEIPLANLPRSGGVANAFGPIHALIGALPSGLIGKNKKSK